MKPSFLATRHLLGIRVRRELTNVTRCVRFSEPSSSVWFGILKRGDTLEYEEATHNTRRSADHMVLLD